MNKIIDKNQDTMLYKLNSVEDARNLVSDVWMYCKDEGIEGNIVQLWNINEYFTMYVAADLEKYVSIVDDCLESI